jgi:hypothetical protein
LWGEWLAAVALLPGLLLLLCQYGHGFLEWQPFPFQQVVAYLQLHMVWVLCTKHAAGRGSWLMRNGRYGGTRGAVQQMQAQLRSMAIPYAFQPDMHGESLQTID